MSYNFQTQLTKGESAERQLDAHFAEWFEVQSATRDEQRMGIDRWFIDRASRTRLAVEYKADWRAAQTGNAFIETVSVDTAHKAGWAYTSNAQVLLYYCPGPGGEQVYWLLMTHIRAAIQRWQKYPTRRIPNDGYFTEGLLVPLWELERMAKFVVNVGGAS